MSELPWEIGSVSKRAYDSVQPLAGADAETAWSLLTYVDALGRMFQPVADLAEDGPNGEPGWSKIVDLDRAPDEALAWLGQFIGVQVDPSFSPDAQRQQIRSHERWSRGTPAWIANSIRHLLTGSQTVDIIERDTSPYHYTVNTWSDETPPDTTFSDLYTTYNTFEDIYLTFGTFEDMWLDDPREYIRFILANLYKPGGLQMTYTVSAGSPAGNTFENLYVEWETFSDIYNTFQTMADIR